MAGFTIARAPRMSIDIESKVDEAAPRVSMDEDAFRAFYDRNAGAVWAYLSRVTGDRQLADDLLQEAFYRFVRAGANHESESHRRNSLFQIATNLGRDLGRRRRHDANHVPLDEETVGAQPPEGGTADLTDLGRAMARLKASEREMLWLAYAQGLSHREIAGVLGLKAASIRMLLFRVRGKLAALLRGEGMATRNRR